jgi:molybdate transport system regulatory protein
VEATGCKGGGGARVTEAGERAVKLFWTFHDDLQKFLIREQTKLMPLITQKRRRL